MLLRDLHPPRTHFCHAIPDLLVLFWCPRIPVQQRVQVIEPPFPALVAASVLEASGDHRPIPVAVLNDKMLELLILIGAPRLALGNTSRRLLLDRSGNRIPPVPNVLACAAGHVL